MNGSISRMICKIKPGQIEGFMKKAGMNDHSEYEIVGTIGEKILLLVGDELVDLYPSKVRISRIERFDDDITNEELD